MEKTAVASEFDGDGEGRRFRIRLETGRGGDLVLLSNLLRGDVGNLLSCDVS